MKALWSSKPRRHNKKFYRTCLKKVTYQTREIADAALPNAQDRMAWAGNGHLAERMEVYKCRYCAKWHIGKNWDDQ